MLVLTSSEVIRLPLGSEVQVDLHPHRRVTFYRLNTLWWVCTTEDMKLTHRVIIDLARHGRVSMLEEGS